MKKFSPHRLFTKAGLALLIICVHSIAYAQYWDGSTTVKTTTTSYVGLGTSTPGYDLDIWHSANYSMSAGFSPVLNIKNTRYFPSTPPTSYLGADYDIFKITNIDDYGTYGSFTTSGFSINTSGMVTATNLTTGSLNASSVNSSNINSTGLITANGDISSRPGTAVTTTIGAAWGSGGMYGTGYIGFNLSRDNVSTGNWSYYTDGANNGGSVIYGDIGGGFNFATKINTGISSGYYTDADVVNNVVMHIDASGKVVIGHGILGNTPNDYNLYVSKGILTEKLKVANSGDPVNWADFVFKKDYKLMPLNKVDAYVQQNKHLPGIPSADEVAKNGIDIADMDAKLLQKIEELTLYIIDLKKENEGLHKEITEVKQHINH